MAARPRRRHLWLLGVALLALASALAGLGARATYSARTSADEPQYLLTAQSLADDFSIDISDELARRAYLPYHEVTLDPQTYPLDSSGRQVSPHDPLLPALLAVPMAVAGWVGAKVALAAVAACCAALTAGLAHSRFGISKRVAVTVVAAGFTTIPLAAYGTQVYPEMAAGLAVLIGIAGLTGGTACDSDLRRTLVLTLAAVIALPWLAVKYVPVAAVLGVALLVRLRNHRTQLVSAAAIAALAAIAYLAAHQWLYGGWTVYAAGDHFVGDGEFSVVGTQADPVGRTRRLVGLLVDRQFGIAAWSPLWLVLPFAVVHWLRRHRGYPTTVVAAVVGVAWLNATFVALTMHGWWVPGRQLVVALPAALILVAGWVEADVRRRLPLAAALGLLGAVNWLWLAFEASTERRTLIVDFADTASWPYRLVQGLLPDGIAGGASNDLLLLTWTLLLAAAVAFSEHRRAAC
ncbi:MAG: hypothetical protein R2770_01935 [Acidimicrobiales bacterium]